MLCVFGEICAEEYETPVVARGFRMRTFAAYTEGAKSKKQKAKEKIMKRNRFMKVLYPPQIIVATGTVLSKLSFDFAQDEQEGPVSVIGNI